MGSTGNLAPPPEPLALPQAQPVTVRTAQDVGLQPPPQMPPVYYGGAAGGVASVADKVLTGWMAGKKMSEDRMRQKAAQSIGDAKSAVDVVGQTYRSAVEANDQDKIASSSAALKSAWKNYMNMAQQYVAPPPDQKTGVKQKLKNAFVPQGPQLYQQATLDVLNNTDPTTLYHPTKTQSLQQQGLQNEVEEQGQRKQINDLTIEQQKDARTAQQDYINAITNGDTAAQQKAAQSLQAMGKNVVLPSTQQLQQQVTQNALDGMAALKGGKQWAQLSDLQRGAMVKEGVAPQEKNAFQAGYLGEVGEGKRFKTAYEAAHQYMLDERTSRVMGMKPTAIEELRRSQQVIMQHDLQDPDIAKKYGIDPLKPGQQPPQWIVEKEADKRYRETSSDKAEDRIYSDQAVSKIFTHALANYSPVEQEIIKARFLVKDPDTGMYAMNDDPDVSGMDPMQAKSLYNSFRNRSKAVYGQYYPEATGEVMQNRLGPEAPTLTDNPRLRPPPTGMNNNRSTSSDVPSLSPPPDQNATPPPPPAQKFPPMGNYVITGKDGKSLYNGKATPLTAEQAQKAVTGGYSVA